MRKIMILLISIVVILIIVTSINYNFFLNPKQSTGYNETGYNEAKQINKVSNYNNPIIPDGFKKVETEGASWKLENGIPKGWNNGLVIEDELGNQFVWVPVLNKYENQEYLISENEEEIQLFKYGGFYISRFEAGVPEELQLELNNISVEKNNIIAKPVSKKNVKPWNYISYKNANESAKLMYNSEKIKSSLMSLNKSIIVMEWLKNKGYDISDTTKWGNHSNSAYRFTGLYSIDFGKNYQFANNILKDDIMIIGTGSTERNMTNNIYDLAGNLREYTNTEFEDTKYHYSVGGHFGRSGKLGGSPASEQYAYSDEPTETTGFRICLDIL